MDGDRLDFVVRDLSASVAEGIPIEVGGRRLESGRVVIGLDDDAPPGSSGGILDYAHGRADVRFRVRADFPDLAEGLRLAGLDGEAMPPVRGELVSRGDILPDHSFSLSGTCTLCAHELLSAEALEATVLPGT
jgi:hypothetical protein